jgi:hypothetical protein
MSIEKTVRNTILAASAGAMAIGIWVGGGLGVRSKTIEHPFKQGGINMAVVKNDVICGRDYFDVESFDKSLQLAQSMKLMYVSPKLEGTRFFNYSGTSDNGEEISVNLRGYSVKQRLER